jgi:hypothetical protein
MPANRCHRHRPAAEAGKTAQSGAGLATRPAGAVSLPAPRGLSRGMEVEMRVYTASNCLHVKELCPGGPLWQRPRREPAAVLGPPQPVR